MSENSILGPWRMVCDVRLIPENDVKLFVKRQTNDFPDMAAIA